MNHFIAMLKREYWEWRKVIFWTIGVFSFLLLLTLIPLNRLTNEMLSVDNSDMQELATAFEHWDLSEEEQEALSKYIKEMENVHSNIALKTQENMLKVLVKNPMIIVKAYSLGIITGFAFIQLIVVFISLFYFSDSLYKERSNDSTFYFRSLPMSDHKIILSKLAAGGFGFIGLTVIMMLLLFAYSHFALMVLDWDIWKIFSEPLSRVNMAELFFDWVLYQIVVFIWSSPFILFLMLVSASVKNRPLIIGIGLPILASTTLTVIFGENAFVTQIIDVFDAIEKMTENQYPIEYISNWTYFFSIRTFMSILVSGALYFATWKMYRKNISTN